MHVHSKYHGICIRASCKSNHTSRITRIKTSIFYSHFYQSYNFTFKIHPVGCIACTCTYTTCTVHVHLGHKPRVFTRVLFSLFLWCGIKNAKKKNPNYFDLLTNTTLLCCSGKNPEAGQCIHRTLAFSYLLKSDFLPCIYTCSYWVFLTQCRPYPQH